MLTQERVSNMQQSLWILLDAGKHPDIVMYEEDEQNILQLISILADNEHKYPMADTIW